MMKIKSLLLLPILLFSSCKEISSVFNKDNVEPKEETKEEVKEETYSKEEIRDMLNSLDFVNKEDMEKFFKLYLRNYFSKEEIIEMIKEALKDTYSTSEVDHMINSLEGERVVESWRQEESYYRIYSDGWIEQGGKISINNKQTKTVSIHKEMLDTQYMCIVSCYMNGISGNSSGEFAIFPYSTSQVRISSGDVYYKVNYVAWEVKGFMKIEENQEATENEN